MQGVKVCVVLVVLLAMLWGVFLSYFEVGMSVATTSDRDPLRAEAPWEGPASPQGRWGGCWLLFAGLETREKSGWRAVLLS